jgi:quinol monooxygenase YgiN
MTKTEMQLPRPAANETGPYALSGTARARPGHADALETRLLELVAPTRQEPGALAYHVHRSRDDEELFVFYEVWRSVEDLRRHLEQPYIQDFLKSRGDYLVGDLNIQWLRMSSPYPLPDRSPTAA